MKFFGSRSRHLEHELAIGEPRENDTLRFDPDISLVEKRKEGDAVSETMYDDEATIIAGNCPTPHLQAGVKKVEAITLTWTSKELYLAYALSGSNSIFSNETLLTDMGTIQFQVAFYVTSSFALLPLTGTTNIVSGIVGGVFRLPTAKFIDLIGRAEGFALMTMLAMIGLAMMAATKNVETYAAAQVFYWVGFNGMAYVLDVFMADTSSLKNRALVFSFSTAPYIFTTFIGPRAGDSILKTSGWPWAYGMFAIITPFIVSPIIALLYINQRKAIANGTLIMQKRGMTLGEKIKFYFWEFDIFGLLLIISGFVLFLLPFALSQYQRNTWDSPNIISMLVVGVLCLIAFPLYEKYLAPKCFIPWRLFLNDTVIGACLLSSMLFTSFYMWDSYFNPYLQVVHGLSFINAGYVSNIYSIGSCAWGIIVALAIRISGRFKWIAFVSLCLEILGVGLMIMFRSGKYGIGYIIMTQILIAFGGGGLVICEEMAVMAAAPHAGVASMLALIALFSSVGGAIGQAVSAAIYIPKFTEALHLHLPGNATLNKSLVGSLTTQLLYPMGSPERTATIAAYDHTMFYLCIVSTAFLVPCFGLIYMWRNFKIMELRQVKGRVV
ncbi:major facilitator superfamily domain-containing protein [Amylocarpus encephaloides]|uniref:Major facilitator superfamily domain-containing protein n=1 Tax=Amylocarpus encephaloides TaxID=45428 RepID=A0A9P7YGL1_9HELO|nr:major facilitator superfamily domain-containing protein [Amylocarpus encephaloides]